MSESLAALAARTKRAHEAAAAALPTKSPQAPLPSARAPTAGPAKRLRTLPAPRYAERSMFMSSSASSVHAKAPERAPRPTTTTADDGLDLRDFARKVERLGASKLQGLSKKDQDARVRAQLGLRDQKSQKMPLKRLQAVRKKQRKQDSEMADLAKQAGMAPRRKPSSSLSGRPTQAGHGKGAGGAPSLGGALRGGVLHVSNTEIRRARFAARSGERSGGKGGGKGKGGGGGKGWGGGGGKGGGRGGGWKW